MQNNSEQIFDGFIRGKLENTAPDMALLNSCFNTFLLERKEKKNKRRWFFWLFFLILAIPPAYYIISNHSNSSDSNPVFERPGKPFNEENVSIPVNETVNKINPLTDSSFATKKDKPNSLLQDGTEDKYENRLKNNQQDILDSNLKSDSQNNSTAKNTIFDSNTVSRNIVIASPAYQLVDSTARQKGKLAPKNDTFYIVW